MVERQEYPVKLEPGSEHPRPLVPGEHPEHPRPHDVGPSHPLPHELEQLRPIAEDLIIALESEDHELKIEAVVGVLSRFELKKTHFGPKPGPKPGHPVPGEHPKPPRPPHPRP